MSSRLQGRAIIIDFGRRSFTSKSLSASEHSVSFKIDDWWMLNGYQHPVRYPRSKHTEVLDWCSAHAPNAHLAFKNGRSVLFKSEAIATQFKLTFSEEH
jgi:hypothetical protein